VPKNLRAFTRWASVTPESSQSPDHNEARRDATQAGPVVVKGPVSRMGGWFDAKAAEYADKVPGRRQCAAATCDSRSCPIAEEHM
jgi:hypothetical protein